MTTAKPDPSGDDHRVAQADAGKCRPAEQDRGDPLFQRIRPLQQLPRGKNTWNPEIIRKWWFWPASAAVLFILHYLYPWLWRWLGP